MSKKLRRVAGIYAAALILTLGIVAAINRFNLSDYRYAAKYSAQRSLEETVGAVSNMSETLKKSAYAVDGSMCGKVCAQVYADAQAAQAALSTLPFSTHELEKISGFLGVAGDYSYSLCSEAAESGFTAGQLKTLSQMSDRAAELTASLQELRGALNDKLITMDSRELRLENVGVEESEKLSARLLKYEADFPAQKDLSYDGRYSAQEENAPARQLTDTQMLTLAADFADVGLGELKRELDYEGEDGRRCYSAGELMICVSRRGVESMAQTRLISQGRISSQQAQEIASAFLNAHGYDSVQLSSSENRGAVESMEFIRAEDDVLWVDELVKISVALDDGSIYSFNAESYSGETPEPEWTLSPEQAAEKLPEGAKLEELTKTVMKSPGGRAVPCYELLCEDGAKIYVDAERGVQCRIELPADA